MPTLEPLPSSHAQGMGGWLRLLAELLVMGRLFHIVLVEPCVQGGNIVPCGSVPKDGSTVNPLSAYLDMVCCATPTTPSHPFPGNVSVT